ncbi:MAG: tRNA preQ1(34) S-adenosylmethionine ribosyltransferase-isomerase QueA [Caldimonas sp.]
MSPTYTLSDFDFALPAELIAQHPTEERSASRLLDATGAGIVDRVFRDLPELLGAGDLLVVNDTRVIRARLIGTKASGGAVEALVERVLPGHEALAHLRASKPPRAGSVLRFADAFDVEVLGRGGAADSAEGALFRLRFPDEPHALLERHGQVPLPPYITHRPDADDARRYQTVFADRPGAVAAPTAALHFDADLLERLRARRIGLARVTLHVGAGTFQPVRSDDLAGHRMHSERFDIPQATVAAIAATRAAGGRIVAVGTTTLRALEAAARDAAGAAAATPSADDSASDRSERSTPLRACSGETDIFITPGFAFRIVDLLITNFHLPKSTLMMLVSAFAGHARVMALYRHAIASRYRFFSYGDAMLLARDDPTARG